jgi:extracellular factor (EF) 3-hydroxypalmitic acid methyl ester biosynthesis protein
MTPNPQPRTFGYKRNVLTHRTSVQFKPGSLQEAILSLNREMIDFEKCPPKDSTLGFHLGVCAMYRFTAITRAMELEGWTSEDILGSAAAIRELMGKSPLLHRLQTWPRGYPGDFESAEALINRTNQSEPGSWAYWLEEAVLQSAAAQQHRNKIQHQAQLIRDIVHTRKGKAQVLSIGCGGCADILQAFASLDGFEGKLFLNDSDPDALALAAKRMGTVTDRFCLLPMNALKAVKRLEKESPFDLVIAGGLFDSLSDEAIAFALRSIYGRLLRNGGTLLFTNIAKANPFRPWMEYAVNWKLIERSEEQILELCTRVEIPKDNVAISRDGTSLTLLVQITQPNV